MCLQLVGCSQHHPLSWNVSWAGDNPLGFLLSHHKNPSQGQLCYGCPAHICEADSELQMTKKTLLRNTFHFSLGLQCDWCWRDWVMCGCCMWTFIFRLVGSAVPGWQPCDERGKMRRWTRSLHRWRFFSSREHGWNTCMRYGLTSRGFESCHGYNVLIFNIHTFVELNALKKNPEFSVCTGIY